MRVEYVRIPAQDVAWTRYRNEQWQLESDLRRTAQERAGYECRPYIQHGVHLITRSDLDEAFHVYFDVPTPEGLLL